MGVAIDEARQHGELREVYRFRAGGQFGCYFRGAADGFDAVAFNPDDLILRVLAGAHVEKFSGTNCNFGWGGGLGLRCCYPRNCGQEKHH